MSNLHIHSHLHQYLANNLHLIRQHNLDHHTRDLAHFPHSLPILTPQQIRSICKAQEKNILEKVIPIKPYNLFQQIAKVCPYERDLKQISNEQVDLRMAQCGSKVYSSPRAGSQSCEDSSLQQSEQSFFSELNIGNCMMDENSVHCVEQSMNNIFQICQNQLGWNQADLLQFN